MLLSATTNAFGGDEDEMKLSEGMRVSGWITEWMEGISSADEMGGDYVVD